MIKYKYYLNMLDAVAAGSRDQSTKVGAMIVGPDGEIRSTGYNGFPRGVNDSINTRYERPLKYKWTEHAERNAIFHAARFGAMCKGCTLFSTHYPCTDCARAIIQAGIIKIILKRQPDCEFKDRWNEDALVAAEMLSEAKIIVEEYDVELLP